MIPIDELNGNNNSILSSWNSTWWIQACGRVWFGLRLPFVFFDDVLCHYLSVNMLKLYLYLKLPIRRWIVINIYKKHRNNRESRGSKINWQKFDLCLFKCFSSTLLKIEPFLQKKVVEMSTTHGESKYKYSSPVLDGYTVVEYWFLNRIRFSSLGR